MKKILLFVLLAAAAIATASCSKEEPAQSETTQNGIVLRATVDQAAATRATLSDGDSWTFAFSQNDVVFVRNDEMSPYKYWMFTKGTDDFTCPSAEKTKSLVDWYAYFPQVIVYFNQQSGTKEDVANRYALSGTTKSPTTGEKGLSIAMAPQVAILVIDNQKGSIDINIKTGPDSWVHSLRAKTDEAGFDLVTEETKVSLLTTNTIGLHYIAVPADVQLCIKDGDTEIKSITTAGFKAGKYYELTLAKPTFTVTFDANGHGGISPRSLKGVPYGSTITKPADPTDENYVFIGWYKDKECKTPWNFYTDVVTTDTTLYAGWIFAVLPGEFSVSATKKVHFSPGNLYFDSRKFNFEANQYDVQSSWSTSHVSHFYWSKDYNKAVAQDFSGSSDASDVLFTNVDDFTVNVGGVELTGWRTLSKAEWQYLFDARPMKNEKDRHTLNITYGGIMGLVLYPDDYNKDPLSGTVTDLPEGVVFLPAVNRREGSELIHGIGDFGYYWSSSAYDDDDSTFAYNVYFSERTVYSDFSDYRKFGFSIRLVTEVK